MELSRLTIILYVLALILMLFGILVFFAPKLLIKISEPLNKEMGNKKKSRNVLLPTDERVFQRRHIIGPILVIIGVILLYYSYFLF